MAKQLKMKIGRRKTGAACGPKKSVSGDDLVAEIRFLASAGRLKSKAQFTKAEKDDLLNQMQRGNASYEMLYDMSETMNNEKNFDVIITMLKKKSKYNQCDQNLIMEAAQAFVRDVGEK